MITSSPDAWMRVVAHSFSGFKDGLDRITGRRSFGTARLLLINQDIILFVGQELTILKMAFTISQSFDLLLLDTHAGLGTGVEDLFLCLIGGVR